MKTIHIQILACILFLSACATPAPTAQLESTAPPLPTLSLLPTFKLLRMINIAHNGNRDRIIAYDLAH